MIFDELKEKIVIFRNKEKRVVKIFLFGDGRLEVVVESGGEGESVYVSSIIVDKVMIVDADGIMKLGADVKDVELDNCKVGVIGNKWS